MLQFLLSAILETGRLSTGPPAVLARPCEYPAIDTSRTRPAANACNISLETPRRYLIRNNGTSKLAKPQCAPSQFVKDVKFEPLNSRREFAVIYLALMRSARPSWMLVLVAALVALVPLLAVLQYRWVGQVSQAERQRMRATLDAAMKNLSDDFDNEITRAYFDLQIDIPRAGNSQAGSSDRDQRVNNYGTRYQRWLSQAAHPQLVKNIYLIEQGPRVLRFKPTTSAFESAAWPPELSTYRSVFERNIQPDPSATPLPLRLRGIETVLDEVPALVMPIPTISFMGDRLKVRVVTPEVSVPGFVVVQLDREFMTEQLIPELARRYLANQGQFDYNVAVVRTADPANIIYRSDPSHAVPDAAGADGKAGIFRVRFEMPGILDFKHDLAVTRVEAEKSAVLKKDYAVQYFTSHSATSTSSEPEKENKFNASMVLVGGEGSRWQLLATHRSGSLDAAVARMRWRNLAISFGMLLLLSVSIALILISSLRASKLARQQIEFVAGVSHELRTPLAVIRSAAENLADGVIDDREQVRRYGQLIESEGKRLSTMIEQTLEFAGIQSGKQTYTLQPIEVERVISAAIDAAQPLLDENGFTLERTIESGLPLVDADQAALSRAIYNLINNAVKYGELERWVRVAARAESSTSTPEIVISVEDRGAGISASEVNRIFEPFYRGRDAIAAQIHGNGLGLSLVRHVVEAHGGKVLVESEPGRGSRFCIRLPALAREPAEVHLTAQPSRTSGQADL